jgi:hypothetical protein
MDVFAQVAVAQKKRLCLEAVDLGEGAVVLNREPCGAVGEVDDSGHGSAVALFDD